MRVASTVLISFILGGCSFFQTVDHHYAKSLSNDDLCQAMGSHLKNASAFMVLYKERVARGERIDNERCFAIEQHAKSDSEQIKDFKKNPSHCSDSVTGHCFPKVPESYEKEKRG